MLAVQLATLVIGLPALTAMPPRAGRMLVLPITTQAAALAPATVIAAGALLVARGPVTGSLVVEGDRARLLGPLLAGGSILFAAPAAGCGSSGTVRS